MRLPLLILACLAACGTKQPVQHPNVLLISLDSVRADELTPYGAKPRWQPDQVITPALQALAASGLTFDQAVSTTSWTLPAHMALLTGLPDPVHGVTDNQKSLDPGITTLAENLKSAGYQTAGYFSGPNLHPVFGFSQGFDSYENLGAGSDNLQAFVDESLGSMAGIHQASHRDITSPALVAAAGEFMIEASAEGDPFFCLVHFWDPHYDYVAPPETEAKFVRPDFDRKADDVSGNWRKDKRKRDWDQHSVNDLVSLYHAELNFTDSYIARLLTYLDDLDIAEDTVVILLADHGEEFFDHGRFGHQRTLFDEVVRVPLIIRWPGHLEAGARVAGQARIQDLFATVCDLADIAPPNYAAETLFGESLRPLWEEPGHPGRDQILNLEIPVREISMRGIRSAETDATSKWINSDGVTLYFDLVADPGEKQTLPDKHSSLVELDKLNAQIEAARAALPLTGKGNTADLDAATRAELERLGYL